MSIQSKFIEDLAYHDGQKAKLYTFWQLIAECLPAKLLDLPFSNIMTYPGGSLLSITLSSYDHDETWMDTMRTLFAAEANCLFKPIEPVNYSWDRTRVKSIGVIYEDSINFERPVLEVILVGPPTVKCRTVRVIEHVEEQEYIEAHDVETEIIVCGDNVPAGAILVEEN